MRAPRLAVLILAAALPWPSADAQPAGQTQMLPDTPAGRVVEAFLIAFNSDEDGAMERFFVERSSPESRQRRSPAEVARMMRRLRGDQGTLALRRAERASDEELVVLVEGSSGHLLRLTFSFVPGVPQGLEGIGFAVVEADEPPPTEYPPMTLEHALAAARTAVDEAVAADEFSGTVLIARDGSTVLLDAWGLASREHGVPNRVDTAFNLGSINKLFTKVSVGQLVASGVLSLDDTLGRWLPEYPNREAREKITVRHLVEMTSGIGDFFGEAFDAAPKDRFRHNRDYLGLFAGSPLLFEPGSQRRYSNGGYIVLGEVVARASGQDYYDYVQENVFDPAAMTRAAWHQADEVVPGVAEGYTRRWDGTEHAGEPRRRNLYTRPARGSAAGGGYATAEDLLRFTNALLADELLPPVWTEWVLGGPEPTPDSPREAAHDRGGSGFGGGAPGINAMVELDLERRVTIIVMSNLDPPAASRLAQRLRPIMEAVKETPSAP